MRTKNLNHALLILVVLFSQMSNAQIMQRQQPIVGFKVTSFFENKEGWSSCAWDQARKLREAVANKAPSFLDLKKIGVTNIEINVEFAKRNKKKSMEFERATGTLVVTFYPRMEKVLKAKPQYGAIEDGEYTRTTSSDYLYEEQELQSCNGFEGQGIESAFRGLEEKLRLQDANTTEGQPPCVHCKQKNSSTQNQDDLKNIGIAI